MGKNNCNQFDNVNPIVGLFVSDDMEKLEWHKEQIPEELWDYVRILAEEYRKKHPSYMRNGLWFLRKIGSYYKDLPRKDRVK